MDIKKKISRKLVYTIGRASKGFQNLKRNNNETSHEFFFTNTKDFYYGEFHLTLKQ
jgi:hypothetical protein